VRETRRIALLLDQSLGFVREVIRGVRIYAAAKPHWVLRDGPPSLRIVAHLRDWRPHGIIASLVVPRVARELIRVRRELVDTAYVLEGLKVPTVDVDHTAVGRMAAEYLLERKFRHFGFFGSESAAYSRIQESAFRARVGEAGHGVSSCYTEYLPDLATAAVWRKSAERVCRWLRRLGKPAAVLCCEDAPARYLADVCREIGLRVPDDVALLGVGSDEMECHLAQPALSSIAVPSQRIGFEAARLLDRLMAGEECEPGPHLLAPLHVVSRHSTDVTAVEDETVQAALQYVREHAWASISVAGVADAIAVSRRLLERRFREILGRSVLEEIHRLRVDRAKELLVDTHLPIETVAAQSGFSSTRRLDVVFGKLAGTSPTSYRRQSQADPGLDRVP
jgi:LacI family transcriptional regulator